MKTYSITWALILEYGSGYRIENKILLCVPMNADGTLDLTNESPLTSEGFDDDEIKEFLQMIQKETGWVHNKDYNFIY